MFAPFLFQTASLPLSAYKFMSGLLYFYIARKLTTQKIEKFRNFSERFYPISLLISIDNSLFNDVMFPKNERVKESETSFVGEMDLSCWHAP